MLLGLPVIPPMAPGARALRPATAWNGMGGPYLPCWLLLTTILRGRVLHLSPLGIQSHHLSIGDPAAIAEQTDVHTATVGFAPMGDVGDAMRLRLQGLGNTRHVLARPTSELARC